MIPKGIISVEYATKTNSSEQNLLVYFSSTMLLKRLSGPIIHTVLCSE